MSIKDLFNNKGTPKIQKSVTTEEMVDQVESSEFVEAKRKQFEQFVPPIDFATASNFAKFGSAELYYEKAFERIHQYYPYDGTLHEKVEFENSSSYLDKYVFDNLYPRTNGYVNFDGSQYITVFGGPHTASMGMDGKPLNSTFDYSMKYDEEKKRTSAFEFRGEDGITAEFWLKPSDFSTAQQSLFHVSGADGSGEILLQKSSTTGQVKLRLVSGSSLVWDPTFNDFLIEDEWNHYAITLLSGSDGLTAKAYRNGQLLDQITAARNIPHILPTTDSLNMTIGSSSASGVNKLTGSMDEFRFWKTARTPEDIFNTWFIPVGGGTNKHDANVDLSLYFKFNEGITGTEALDKITLDYSGRINNGTVVGYSTAFRSTGSAITEKLGEPEFQDPIIYSVHPDVVSKKDEYKTSGSLADLENTSMFYRYFPGWMQEEDEQNGKQLKYLSQVLGSYLDTLWHQINFVNKIHDHHYIQEGDKALPFAKKLLYDQGFVIPDLFVDATKIENLRQKDDNEVFEKEINEVRNTIYHNIYNNLGAIYKSKGTEKSFRNFFRSIGIGQDVVKLKMYADDSTFVLRNNYEYKSYERKFINFNVDGHFDATLFQTSSTNNLNIHIPKDSNYTGSFTLQSEVVLPRKQRKNEVNYNPFPYLSSSIMGYKDGNNYTTATGGLQAFVVHSALESSLANDDKQRIKFVLTGSDINLETDWFDQQYENNKWSLAVRIKHATYPRPNISGSIADDYLLEFYGVEADGNTERNSFSLSTSSVAQSYYTSDKIFYAGANKTNFSGSTLHYSDIKLGYVRYWHSYLSDEAIKQHAFDSETFGANEPFEQDLVDTYPVEIPREKTLAFHWAFNDLTSSDSSGEFLVSDLSSGSSDSDYGLLSDTIQRYVAARGFGFNASSSKVLDKNYLYSARKRLPDDLMSSDLTTIKTDETEQFFVDDDVSDNFYSFEKSMWGTVSDEMMNMFSTALDLNNLIGQPNQRYHHKYGMAEFLRDRFFDDVENEPDIQKFTSFYKWIDDSISIALQQLTPASARFSEKINNIIESHVLERNKYIHQIPITTNFESTEGSIKGISEMKYDWQYGHAPTDTSNEGNNVLWHQDRNEKEGLRETLRNSKNNHSIQSSGLLRREIDGTTRVSDTYAVRKFAKTYDIGIVSQNTIHGGTNFGRKKNLQLFHESISPAGAVGSLGEPQNIITVGAGTGQAIVETPTNNDAQPTKRKYQVDAKVGNQYGNEYGHDILGDFIIPMNVMSGTINSGFNAEVHTKYKQGVHFANLHNDIVGNYNETSIQGPFTEQHVGGLQYRHIDITEDVEASGSRPEGWGLLLKDHPYLGPDADGAFGFVGADYQAPYPGSGPKASRYRDEHAKRPVNLRNIKTVSGSWKAGNYKNELEIFQISPTFQKTWAIEAYDDPNIDILPPFIADALPDTTHYQTLMGFAGYVSGNYFGHTNNNRQFDGGIVVPAIPGTAADGTFELTGSPNPAITASGSFQILGTEVEGTFASGSFDVTGATIQEAFASGSFEVTGAQVLGTNAIGSFTMTSSYVPAVSASYDFTVNGASYLGTESSASFTVSGAIVNPAPATASFDVSALPVGGNRSYAIFEANYRLATDAHKFELSRNSNSTGVEIDYNNASSSGYTTVSPVIPQSASFVTGSSQYYSGSISYTNTSEYILSFWTKFPDQSLTTLSNKKTIYTTTFSSAPTKYGLEIYFDASPNHQDLIVKQYVLNKGSHTGGYKKWTYANLGANTDIQDWHNMVFFFLNGEQKLYLNGNSIANTSDASNLGTNSSFSGLSIDMHTVMNDINNAGSQPWGSAPSGENVEISDLIIFPSSSVDLTIAANQQTLVDHMYVSGGIYGPNQTQASSYIGSITARYTFGDDPSDGYRAGEFINDTVNSYNLTSSFTMDSFVESVFATPKSSTQYFDDLKSAIESHNSDGNFFNVDYVTFLSGAANNMSTTWYVTSSNTVIKPGENFGTQITAGDNIEMATFFISAKNESSTVAYDINPSIDNLFVTDPQKKSFVNLKSVNSGSAQTNALASFEDSNLVIDTATFKFDQHNNSQTGNIIDTFTSSFHSCLSGSNNDGEIKNTSYSSISTLDDADAISVSVFAAYNETLGGTQTLLTLKSASGNSIYGALSVYLDNTAIRIRAYQTSTIYKIYSLNHSTSGINKEDLNHFVFTFDISTMTFEGYVNGVNYFIAAGGTGTSFSHSFSEIWITNTLLGSIYELTGKMTQLAIWDKVLTQAEVSEVYNNGRVKDLLRHSAVSNLVHWYKLGTETSWPSSGSDLSSFLTIPDSTPRKEKANLTVADGTDFTSAQGLPDNTISDTTFWNSLSSSIEANVSGYDVAYVDNSSYATFTITNEVDGTAGNNTALSENSSLITNLESQTGGGLDAGGAADGDSMSIGTITFTVDDDNESDTSTNKKIQFTGSNSAIWNALSQSIKDNTVFGTISIVDNGDDTATFSLTSSTVGTSNNVSMTLGVGNSFIIDSVPSGGTDATGSVDGHYIQLRPTSDSNDDRYYVVDVDSSGTPDASSSYIDAAQSTNAAWWNLLSASIKADGFDASYVADSPNPGTASFTVTTNVAGAAGNNGNTTLFNGDTFANVSATSFAGGSDAYGAEDGDQIEIDGTTFTITHTSPAGATEILATGSGVTDSVMWAEMQTKIAAQTGYTATTGSNNPRTFGLTSDITGSSENPNITVVSGDAFSVITSGTSGTDESGAETGDSITIDGSTIVVPIEPSQSTTDLHNALSQSIKDNTDFDTITITDLGTGYHRFDLTSSVAGAAKNVAFTQNSNGIRATFQNLDGANGGIDEAGAEDGDELKIGSVFFPITNGAPLFTQISSTGSTSEFHNALSQSIKDRTDFDTINIVDLGNGYHRFNLTSSLTGSDYNISITQASNGSRATFDNLVNTDGGTDETGAEAGDSITIDGVTFTIVDGAPANGLEISTTGSDSQFHNALSQSIKDNTNFDTITITDLGGYHRFDLTSSAVGALGNATITADSTPGDRTTFASVSSISNGVNASGIVDGDHLRIGSLRLVLTASSPGDSSPTFYVETTGTSTQIWSSLESKIEANGYSATITDNGDYALFEITSSATGSAQNVAMSGDSPSFSNVDATLLNGTDYIPPVISDLDNVIQIPRTDLTGSQRNITTRFSAPGGPEIQTYGYLDAYTSTYSVHNALPYRNSSVLGSGSGEEGTIRVEDHLGLRRGLKTLRGLHMGKFGIDSQYGEITEGIYPSSGSYNKQHRNTSQRMEYSGSSIITGSNYDNAFINTPIPRSELQYSWIHNATSGSHWYAENDAPSQRILGYAPRDGIVSSSVGFVEAIVFPSASSIFGS